MQAENTSDTSSTPMRFTYKGSGRNKSDAWLIYQVAVIAVLIVFVISMPFISKYPVLNGQIFVSFMILVMIAVVYLGQTAFSDVEVDDKGIRRYWLNMLWQDRKWKDLVSIRLDEYPLMPDLYHIVGASISYKLHFSEKRRFQFAANGPVWLQGDIPGADELFHFIAEHISKRPVTITDYRDRKQPVVRDHLPMPPPSPANY